MEHFNPLLLHNDSPAKFITIGEVMLRLTPPNYEKIRMASNFEASYGGSEANIALALANLGVDSTFFSVVPKWIWTTCWTALTGCIFPALPRLWARTAPIL